MGALSKAFTESMNYTGTSLINQCCIRIPDTRDKKVWLEHSVDVSAVYRTRVWFGWSPAEV